MRCTLRAIMTVAFVLSGRGSLGAVQVGMLKALAERDVQPDLIIGTSVGALNGVFVASRSGSKGVDKLAEVWRGLRRKDVFPISPLSGALGYYGMQNWLVRPTPLEALVRKHTTFERLEDAPVPLHVVATNIRSGRLTNADGGTRAVLLEWPPSYVATVVQKPGMPPAGKPPPTQVSASFG